MHYLYGLLLGLTLQISIGPVFFAILHKSLRENFLEAFKMTGGVALVDALYILLSFTGIAVLLQLEIMRAVVSVLGAGVLSYFAFTYFRNAGRKPIVEPGKEDGEYGKSSSFFYGIKLTAINPLTIIFWTGTFGSLAASGIAATTGQLFLYAAGCITATILFLGLISLAAQFLVPYITPKTMRGADYLVGTVLGGFAVVMFYRAFSGG